jgi:hypothetical protein
LVFRLQYYEYNIFRSLEIVQRTFYQTHRNIGLIIVREDYSKKT